MLEIGNSQIEEEMHNYLSSMDQPSDDGFNTFLISKFVKDQGIKVALNGVEDEIFEDIRVSERYQHL